MVFDLENLSIEEIRCNEGGGGREENHPGNINQLFFIIFKIKNTPLVVTVVVVEVDMLSFPLCLSLPLPSTLCDHVLF